MNDPLLPFAMVFPAFIMGLGIGFAMGYLARHRRSQPTAPTAPTVGVTTKLVVLNEGANFGPCPSCRVPCNLEEWRCGSCGYQLHR